MEPARSCIICRKKSCKRDLLRITFCNEMAILDIDQKINSRGMYFCKNKKCLDKAKILLEKNKFAFKKNVDKKSLIKIIDDIEIELGE